MKSLISTFCLWLPIASFAATKFESLVVDSSIQIGYGITTADVDGDKKTDIILVDKNQVAWYQNPQWQKHVIAEKLTALDHVCVAAQDIDGDGKAEIAIGAGWNPGDTVNSGSVHFLKPPADRTTKWEPVALHHEPTVHRMRWVKRAQGWELVVVPLHGRGNKNGTGEGVKVLAYTPRLNSTEAWPTRVLDQSLHATHNFDVLAWDSDPEEEVLLGGREGIWLMNGSQKTQIAGSEGGGAGEVRFGQKPSRFVAAVEPMHGNMLVLYTPGEPLWKREVLAEDLLDGHALAVGDLLSNPGEEIVVGWRAMNRAGAKVGIRIYYRENEKWTHQVLDDNTMACEDLCLADLDGNGKLDVIAAGRATKNVKIYWNR